LVWLKFVFPAVKDTLNGTVIPVSAPGSALVASAAHFIANSVRRQTVTADQIDDDAADPQFSLVGDKPAVFDGVAVRSYPAAIIFRVIHAASAGLLPNPGCVKSG